MTAAPDRGPRWLEYLPLDELRPDPRNPKNHRLDTLRESVVRWGYSEPVQVDERTGLIVSGHGRRELLLDDRAAGRSAPEGVVVDGAGGWLVPVVRGWASTDDDEAFGYLVAANRIGEQGGWLTERLLAGLEPLAAKGPDMLAGVGYTPDDLSGLLALLQSEQEPVVGATDPDEVPEPPPVPVSRRGDLWLCGPHRVLCGDSTVLADVERVMAGAEAEAVFTDPPYGVKYTGGTVARDALEGDEDTALYDPCCQMGFAFSVPDAVLYLWHAGVKGISAAAAAAAAGWEIRAEIVWNKNLAQFGALGAQYKQKHEPCFYCVKRGRSARWTGPTNEVTVWDVDRAVANEFHPTQKPVALATRALGNHAGSTVLDLFGGSGSTLIAAHSVNWRAFLVEKDERYVDVICRRYQEFTGDVPVLESTGEPHDFCAEPAVVEPAG